jgi:hypothetical protein
VRHPLSRPTLKPHVGRNPEPLPPGPGGSKDPEGAEPSYVDQLIISQRVVIIPQNPVVPLGNVVQAMYNLLENPRCDNFITSLLGTARRLTGNEPVSYRLSDVVNKVAHVDPARGGYRFSPNYSKGKGGGDAGYGMGDMGATIGGISMGGGGDPVIITLEGQMEYAMTGLHETVHLAGEGYTDELLAKAVFIMFGDPNDDPNKIDRNDPNDLLCTSGAGFGTYINEYCRAKMYNGTGYYPGYSHIRDNR